MASPVYELTVERHFSAAHALRCYEGACARVHGHNYRVEVSVAASALDDLGMLMDFTDLKRICDEVVDTLDHTMLNDLEPFAVRNATSERIAEHVYRYVAGRLPESVRLQWVRVWETPSSAATYREA